MRTLHIYEREHQTIQTMIDIISYNFYREPAFDALKKMKGRFDKWNGHQQTRLAEIKDKAARQLAHEKHNTAKALREAELTAMLDFFTSAQTVLQQLIIDNENLHRESYNRGVLAGLKDKPKSNKHRFYPEQHRANQLMQVMQNNQNLF